MDKSSSDQVLNEAYGLIEADKLDEAEALLTPVLEQEPDNVDAWWLYAHAVTDPETARMALNQVLRIDSSYADARTLLTRLDEVQGMPTRATVPPPNLPEDDQLEEPPFESTGLDDSGPIFGDSLQESSSGREAGSSSSQGLRVILGILVVLVIIVVAILLLLNPFSEGALQTTEVPTEVAQQATNTTDNEIETPTAEVAAVASPDVTEDDGEIPATVVEAEQQAATDQANTPTPESAVDLPFDLSDTADEIRTAVADTLSDYELVGNGVGEAQTELGNTLVASVCSSYGSAMRETIDGTMKSMASLSTVIQEDVEALGIALIDCETSTLIRVIATSVADAQAYTEGEIDDAEYEAAWTAAA